ncbi:MAG TPA: hypothetical protein VFZ91_08405 [Allosphingosinicella sp.]
MSIGSLLRSLARALPAVVAAAPGVLDAAIQIQQALRRPKKQEPEPVAP